MKTYLLSALQKVATLNRLLDAEAVLYDKSWEVFNDSGDKEVFIFRRNNELLISKKGIVQKGKWEVLSANTLLIDFDNASYLFNSAFVDNKLIALKLDGTEECMIMIDSQLKKQLMMDSIESVENYLESINPKSNELSITENIVNEEIFDNEDKTRYFVVLSMAAIVIFIIFFFLIKSIANL
jgi:hypothetical protein